MTRDSLRRIWETQTIHAIETPTCRGALKAYWSRKAMSLNLIE